MISQRTLLQPVNLCGVGLHSGQTIEMQLLPAPANHGITFGRADLPGSPEVPATPSHIVDTTLATTMGTGRNGAAVRIATVEHLMAALWGLGVDNVRVLVSGPEVPILDGSAAPFVEAILEAGLAEQPQPKKWLVIKRPVEVRQDDKLARIEPGTGLVVRCTIHFDHPLVSHEPFTFAFSPTAFRHHIAPARTFGFLRDVEAMRSKGLALGGSLHNAVVIGDAGVLNPEGLRFHDEFVRHKVLDALGDMALLGLPVWGTLTLVRPGHALNAALVREILANQDAYEVVELTTTGGNASWPGKDVSPEA